MKRKRLISLLLCILVVLTLCSCGTTKKVEAALVDGIYIGGDNLHQRGLAFYDDGTYYEVFQSIAGSAESYGTWKVKKDQIILTESGGGTVHLTYDYNENRGELTFYYNQSPAPYTKYKD